MMYSLFIFTFAILSCSSSLGFVLKTRIPRFRTSIYSSRNVPINPFLSTPHANNGLLSGITDVSSANFYSANLPLREASEFVKSNRLLYDIITVECNSVQEEIDKYLEDIELKMDEFMEKNTVWDRTDLLRGLDDATRKRGNFVCLLGGKSTGKSLVLGEFSREERKSRKVIYVDMREYSGITLGLVNVLSKSGIIRFQELAKAFVKKAMGIAKFKVIDQVEIDFNSLLGIILKDNNDPNNTLKNLINDIISAYPNEVITLVLDEANLPLTIKDKTSEAKIDQVKETLSLFTTLTKQQTKVNDFSSIIFFSYHNNSYVIVL